MDIPLFAFGTILSLWTGACGAIADAGRKKNDKKNQILATILTFVGVFSFIFGIGFVGIALDPILKNFTLFQQGIIPASVSVTMMGLMYAILSYEK
jgi:uncharacterized membrane protein YfcA